MSDRPQAAASGRANPKRGFAAWVEGRANRKDYWIWMAPLTILVVVLGLVQIPGVSLIAGLPMLFVWIRRLHDMGRTGWWAPVINIGLSAFTFAGALFLGEVGGALLGMLLSLGSIVAFGAIPGQSVANAFGPPAGQRDLAETFG